MAEKKKKNSENQAPQADPKELETLKKELEAKEEELKAKSEELEALKKEMDEKKNDYLRLMAEFDTFRRRTAEEKLELVKSASADTIKGLMGYLKTKGLERIEAKGEVFDTELHEAVTLFPAPTEEQKGRVIDVAQTGYLLGGKVLRFAKVIVGA